MKGLNFVLSIYMGSSFGKVAEGWVGIAGGKLLYVVNDAIVLCVVDVGSWCLSYRCSKNLLSHQTACAIAQLNVERFGKVSSKSFTSPHNPNYN